MIVDKNFVDIMTERDKCARLEQELKQARDLVGRLQAELADALDPKKKKKK